MIAMTRLRLSSSVQLSPSRDKHSQRHRNAPKIAAPSLECIEAMTHPTEPKIIAVRTSLPTLAPFARRETDFQRPQPDCAQVEMITVVNEPISSATRNGHSRQTTC
jgi:hypothetical protein